jgi:hypothetical protein
MGKRKAFLETLREKYPKARALAERQEPGTYGSLTDLEQLPESKKRLQAEKLVIYCEITSGGPDVEWSRLGRATRLVRAKVARGDILRAYENGKLFDVMNKLRLFGRRSDELRGDADKFYS